MLFALPDNFSNPDLYPCTGCQDGYFTEHLVQNRHWTYATLGIDGLQSIVYHGPSPLYCLAAGHVFFGHVHVNKARCFTRTVISKLHHLDSETDGEDRGLFDWEDFERSGQYCLKLSRKGYEQFRKSE
ncbi:hypothetical protein EON63_18545 [archaeon]|nr:MAG: hypothetical protein EON63_18545 [archaeon]